MTIAERLKHVPFQIKKNKIEKDTNPIISYFGIRRFG
jgi:hypothetical protein